MAVIGQSGSGKTYLSKRLIDWYDNLAIIDPKRTFDYPGVKIYDNPNKILREKPSRFQYRPHPDLLDDMDAYNAVYKYCFVRGNIMVYTDDIVGVIPRTNPPRYLKVIYQMGRERNVGAISCFQRPSCVPLILTTESSKFAVFRLTLKEDIKRVAEYVPGYEAGKLAGKQLKHVFFYYDHNADAEQATRKKISGD